MIRACATNSNLLGMSYGLAVSPILGLHTVLFVLPLMKQILAVTLSTFNRERAMRVIDHALEQFEASTILSLQKVSDLADFFL